MHRLLMVLLLVGLIASQAGIGTTAYFTDTELNANSTFQAWVSSQWVQTTEGDFQAGVLDNTDTSSSAGNVTLESVLQEPTTSVGSEESWYFTSWSRRAPVTISNPGSGLTDHQVRVDVTWDADMQPDFDDIRFVDSDDSTELSHWRESYTASTSAIFWVKVPSIPSGNKTIYMYYGNDAASSASDGTATFIFFDDFDDASLDLADWTFTEVGGAAGSCTESGTVIRLTGTDTGDLWNTSDKFLFLSISGNYDNVIVESYTSAWGGAHDTWSKMGGVQLRQSLDAGSKNRIMSPVYSAELGTNSYRLSTGGITEEQYPSGSIPTYNKLSRSGGTSRAWYSTDGISWTELGSQISFTGGLTDPVYLGLHLAGKSTTEHWVEVDWFRVRKYALQEPTTSVGSEESWYFTSWSRRAPVTISNPGSGLTDHQVRVDVTWDADMQPDFDDIRFVDSDDSTELSHWRESYTASTSAIFWVKVPSIPSGNKTIYMYYGNDAASSASDGTATFIFFDDFDDASLDLADWTFTEVGGAAGSCTESGTVIRLTGTDTGDLWNTSDKFLFLSISGNYDNVIVESYTSAWGGAHDTWSKMGGVQLRQSLDAGSKNRIMSPVYSAELGTNSYRLSTGGITEEQYPSGSIPTYNKLSRSGGTSRAWYSTDGISWTELGSQISFTGGLTDPVYLGLHLAGLSTVEHWVEVDWFRVRKYAQPIYVSSGTIASQVLDTGVAGARWDALFWDETRPSNTDITFEVRANDTLFAKGDATPSWTPVGGTSPVTSGLPSGRYMQWRATLTTSDTSKTPTLHEVTIDYY